MPEPNDERRIIDYASPLPPPPNWPRRPLTVNEFGCALVAALYGIPLLIVLTLVFFAYAQAD